MNKETEKFIEAFDAMELPEKIKTIFDILGHTSDFDMNCLSEIPKTEEGKVLLLSCKNANRLLGQHLDNLQLDFSIVSDEVERLYNSHPYIMGKLREKRIEEILAD